MQYNNTLRHLLSLALVVISGTVLGAGQDLGTVGPVWAISEQDMRLAMALEAADVDWAAHQEVLREEASTITANLDGWQVPVAQHTSTRYVDPSITVAEDIYGYVRDDDGSFRWDVLYKAGTRANPLEQARPKTWQLIIDATSDEQMRLAEQIMAKHYHRVSLVLTRGDPGALAKEWDFPVYFAQELHFTRLGVTHTPSLVGVRPERPLELEVTHFAFPHSADLVESYLP